MSQARAGLLDAVEDGEVHTAYGVALAAHGRAEAALSSLEKGVFLRRLWGQKLDLIDGLMALASTVAELGDRERATRCSTRRRRSPASNAPTRACCPPGSRRRGGPPADRRAADDELTERELTVLRHLASDLSEREIAAELYLSFNTVHSHVKSIYRKLGVASRGGRANSPR